MKIKATLFAILFLATTAFSQEASFGETVDDILYHSNRASTIIEMERKHKDFKLVNDNFQVIDSVKLIINQKPTKVAYELVQFVSQKEQALVQFIFVNDWLYGKNISFYFPQAEMQEAEEKYNAINDWLLNNNDVQLIMSGSGDEVYYKDDQIAAGKIRHYPAKRVHYDVWEGTVGLILNIPDIYKLENVHQNKGLWVYITAYNTFDIPLSTKFKFPKVDPPYATIDELAGSQEN